jgi:2-oxoglutarate dehydrogenase E2 component (dihydrolipoamide succinyltransferase)
MNVDIVMPKMGESIQEGTILQWLKKEGEKVERDEIILEISTDKVDTEVPSPDSGVLTQIIAQENDVVEVGNVIAKLDTEASEGTTASAPVAAPTPAPAPAPIAAQAQEAVPAPQGGGDTTEVVMPKILKYHRQ